jgi:hypothetical protein
MVVLGVGIPPSEAGVFLERCAAAGASAVVLRALPDAVPAFSPVLLIVSPGVSWSQVADAVGSAISRENRTSSSWSRSGSGRERSLSDLANAIAAALDAPVTIEDLNSVVLGYSDNQSRGDVGRQETVLGRAVPERYMRALRHHDVFARLYASDDPVRVDTEMLPELAIPRIAVRVTSGGYVVGSIWVATTRNVDELDMPTLRSAAARAAELIDNGTHDQDRRRGLVGTLVDGDAAAGPALAALELSGSGLQLLVIDPSALDGEPLSSRALDRLADTLHLQLAGFSPRALAAAVRGRLIGILPTTDPALGQGDARAAAERFQASTTGMITARAVISTMIAPDGSVADAFADASRAHSMLARSTANATVITTVEDSFVDVVLHDVGERLRARSPELSTPVSRLLVHDREHHTDFTVSLIAYLRAFGQVQEAANGLHVHTNTLRYRLRRLSEISGLDLDEHRARFQAMLELRLRGLLD